MVTWSRLGVPFALVSTSTSLAWSLTANSPSKSICVVLFLCISENWYFEVGEAYFFVDTSVLLRCFYAFVFPILEYCSPVCLSVAGCHLQLLMRQVYSVAKLCPDQNFLCPLRHVAGQCKFLQLTVVQESRCKTLQGVQSWKNQGVKPCKVYRVGRIKV